MGKAKSVFINFSTTLSMIYMHKMRRAQRMPFSLLQKAMEHIKQVFYFPCNIILAKVYETVLTQVNAEAELRVHRIFIHVGPRPHKREGDFSGFPLCATGAAVAIQYTVRFTQRKTAHITVCSRLDFTIRLARSWSRRHICRIKSPKLARHQTLTKNSHVSNILRRYSSLFWVNTT